MYTAQRAESECQIPRCIVCGASYLEIVPDDPPLTDADIAVEHELSLNLAEVA